MPWQSGRLAGPAQLTNSAATIYTAPAAGTYNTGKIKLRVLRFFNADSQTRNLTVSVGTDAANKRIRDAYPMASKTTHEIWGPINLDVGEVIQAFCDTTLVITYEIDGEIETF